MQSSRLYHWKEEIDTFEMSYSSSSWANSKWFKMHSTFMPFFAQIEACVENCIDAKCLILKTMYVHNMDGIFISWFLRLITNIFSLK